MTGSGARSGHRISAGNWYCLPPNDAVGVSALRGANCAFGSAINTASPGGSLVRTGDQAGFMSFPILWACAFSWDPVTGAKRPKMDSPPGDVES